MDRFIKQLGPFSEAGLPAVKSLGDASVIGTPAMRDLLPISKDAFSGPYLQHQLARIYILVGEPDKAMDRLEPLLKMPYYLSPGWLRVDPNFDPLRNNSRFRKLAQG